MLRKTNNRLRFYRKMPVIHLRKKNRLAFFEAFYILQLKYESYFPSPHLLNTFSHFPPSSLLNTDIAE